jgi:hypothetical protein
LKVLDVRILAVFGFSCRADLKMGMQKGGRFRPPLRRPHTSLPVAKDPASLPLPQDLIMGKAKPKKPFHIILLTASPFFERYLLSVNRKSVDSCALCVTR